MKKTFTQKKIEQQARNWYRELHPSKNKKINTQEVMKVYWANFFEEDDANNPQRK